MRYQETTSVCPRCLRRVEARITKEGQDFFLEKECPDHGRWKVPIWRGEPAYEEWARPKEPARPEVCYHDVDKGCPFDCGLCAAHRQYPCSVLLEVTNRCNLACPVCFADSSADPQALHEPGLDTIGWWYERVMTAAGPCSIQISGGEPTLRDDLPEIISLGREKGFSFIQLNTNGLKLAWKNDYVRALRDAGLSTVFLQFDGTEDSVYSALRGRPLLETKKKTIDRCGEAGLGVILVPTLVPGVNMGNVGDIIRFAVSRVPVVRGVHFQPVSHFGRSNIGRERVTLPEVMRALTEQAPDVADRWNLLPPGTENDHCSFHGNFIAAVGGRLRSTSPSLAACSKNLSGKDGLLRTISTVARQWSPSEGGPRCCGTLGAPVADGGEGPLPPDGGIMDLDAFLDASSRYGFSISCMAFQDAWNLDMERLRDCCISIMSPDGRLIPFCAYNLTNERGEGLYRGR